MKKFLIFIFETAKVIVIALAIVLPIRYFLFQPFVVEGKSMEPSFEGGDYLIVDQISYRFREPERGEVIVFRSPSKHSQRLIKRIIGLPGELVEIEDGEVMIKGNGEVTLLEEDYLESSNTDGNVKIILGAEEYFVMGDNRDHSYDSRRFGIVEKENITGRALMRLLPVSSFSKITPPLY